ncbi:MAG TPA: response regulator [Opitutaceae bacterium]|nr:response regulator [Opitutaceae bacterium]
MPRTILVVDDNDTFRGMLCTLLAERGYLVVAARSGQEGLTVAKSNPAIDAVLTDVDMPGMSGFAFCQQLRADRPAGSRELPVWIMTGALQPGLSKRGAAVGATLLLRKPFNVVEVYEQFERAFAAADAAAAKGGVSAQ